MSNNTPSTMVDIPMSPRHVPILISRMHTISMITERVQHHPGQTAYNRPAQASVARPGPETTMEGYLIGSLMALRHSVR